MTDTGSAPGTSPGHHPLRLLRMGRSMVPSLGAVRSMAWARDGRRLLLAAGYSRDQLALLELAGGSFVPRFGLPLTGGAVRSVAWARLGPRLLLAAGNGSGTVALWDVDEGPPASLANARTIPVDDVRSVGWVRDRGRLLLATGTQSGTVRMWTLGGTARPLGQPPTISRTIGVRSMAWAYDGGHLTACCHTDGTVSVYGVVNESLALLATAGDTGARRLGWGRDDERLLLAAGNDDGTVRVWEFADRSLIPVGGPVAAHTGRVGTVAWARSGRRALLATGGEDDGTARVWEAGGNSLTPLGEPSGAESGGVHSLAWASDGGQLLLAVGSDEGSIQLWEAVEDRAVPRLPAYRSDALGVADELARSDEARALAELVTARSARPPLAVGLFGDWGEGKSHFLGLVQEQVDTVARAGNPLAHHAVRQVRFNAWHYAETGLWASLVAELFAQLASPPGTGDPGGAQRSMSRLTAELVSARGLRTRLDAARRRRDRLEEALRERNLWDALSPEQQRQVTDLVGEDALSARLYRQAAIGASAVQERLFTLRTVLRGVGTARMAVFLALPVVVAVAGGLLTTLGTSRRPWSGSFLGVLPLLLGAEWLRGRFGETRTRLQGAWYSVRRIVEKQRARLLTAAEVAAAEVAALERQMQDLTAAGQLAGLIGDRAAAGDYRSQLGVMTQIREDFQRMADLLGRAAAPDEGADAGSGGEDGSGAGAAPGGNGRGGRHGPDDPGARDEADDALPQIDRIIIYVDDLDRCPPARVVEMLEAIHLLLAVELFVVVVAIDPRWLLRAISAHYRDVLDAMPGEGAAGMGASTPAQYLEKIFQVVLTLPALDAGGYARMIDKLVGVRDDRTPPPAPPGASPPPPGPGAARASGGADAASDRVVAGDEDDMALAVPRVDTVRVVERTDPLTLEPDELALLRLLGPPHLVATPRAVTRLANSYGLLTALRRTHREADLAQAGPGAAGAPPYRAGMVLLAALVAYPALGPALCLHLHAEATARPDAAWADFCAALPPASAPADPQWEALRTALAHVTRTATAHGLPLPAPLAVWRDWVLPVARLSFPAGSIVPTLGPA
ncbi:P-loop NTPase fold protein [Streptomyces sp. NPDC021224]|uniref:P-loop NTPase fold protein n=1 Tax=unclassified Streptomyces TaxID=2593676 RepID=UPI0037BC77CA